MGEFDHEGEIDAAAGEIEVSSYAGFQYRGTGILQRISGDFEGVLDSIRSWGLASGEWAVYVLPVRHQGVDYQFFCFCTFLRDKAERTGYIAAGAAFRADIEVDVRALERLWANVADGQVFDENREKVRASPSAAVPSDQIASANLGKLRPATLVLDNRQSEPSRQVLDFLSLAGLIPDWKPATSGFILTSARSALGARLNASTMSSLMERLQTAEREIKQKIARKRAELSKLFSRTAAALDRASDRRVAELEEEIIETRKRAAQRLEGFERRGRGLHAKLKKLASQLESGDSFRRAQAARNMSVLGEADMFGEELKRAIEGPAPGKLRAHRDGEPPAALPPNVSEDEAPPSNLPAPSQWSPTISGQWSPPSPLPPSLPPSLPQPSRWPPKVRPPRAPKQVWPADDDDGGQDDVVRALMWAGVSFVGVVAVLTFIMLTVRRFLDTGLDWLRGF